MSATDIRIYADFSGHWKTRLLERLCGEGAPMRLIELWCAVADSDDRVATGSLIGMSDDAIECAANWRGERGAFVAALLECGFVDGDTQNRTLHNWARRQPWAAKHVDRQRAGKVNASKRWQRHGIGMPDPMPNHAVPNAPNPTQPNPTQEEKRESNAADAAVEPRPKSEHSLTPIAHQVIGAYNEILGGRSTKQGGWWRRHAKIGPKLLTNIRSRLGDDVARRELGWWRALFERILLAVQWPDRGVGLELIVRSEDGLLRFVEGGYDGDGTRAVDTPAPSAINVALARFERDTVEQVMRDRAQEAAEEVQTSLGLLGAGEDYDTGPPRRGVWLVKKEPSEERRARA